MFVHFQTLKAAQDHLKANGWKLVEKSGNYVSDDGSCAARIIPVHGDIVGVQAWEKDSVGAA